MKKSRSRNIPRVLAAVIFCALLGACTLPATALSSSISVDSAPTNASVYVDNLYKGQTPLDVPGVYPPGIYYVMVKKEGYITWSTGITVKQDKINQLTASLTPMTTKISVASTPEGAQILLDGKVRGMTPATLDDVTVGVHSITLKKSRYDDWTTTIDAVTGRTVEVAAQMKVRTQPYQGSISVQSSPANAEVQVNGRFEGISPLIVRQLPPGMYSISLTLEGYETWKSEVDVAEDEKEYVSATLVPSEAAQTTSAATPLFAGTAALGCLSAAAFCLRKKINV